MLIFAPCGRLIPPVSCSVKGACYSDMYVTYTPTLWMAAWTCVRYVDLYEAVSYYTIMRLLQHARHFFIRVWGNRYSRGQLSYSPKGMNADDIVWINISNADPQINGSLSQCSDIMKIICILVYRDMSLFSIHIISCQVCFQSTQFDVVPEANAFWIWRVLSLSKLNPANFWHGYRHFSHSLSYPLINDKKELYLKPFNGADTGFAVHEILSSACYLIQDEHLYLHLNAISMHT